MLSTKCRCHGVRGEGLVGKYSIAVVDEASQVDMVNERGGFRTREPQIGVDIHTISSAAEFRRVPRAGEAAFTAVDRERLTLDCVTAITFSAILDAKVAVL